MLEALQAGTVKPFFHVVSPARSCRVLSILRFLTPRDSAFPVSEFSILTPWVTATLTQYGERGCKNCNSKAGEEERVAKVADKKKSKSTLPYQ